jgi:DNA-binding transcriptional MerR regulator
MSLRKPLECVANQGVARSSRMDKSPDAFRTISEVAEDLDLPQHVLRFWETRFTQIKPMKRGGGRRYYRPQDVDLIKGIRHLLYDQGYTIKGVQKLLRENGNQFIAAVGTGDMAAVAAIAARKQEAAQAAAAAANASARGADDEMLVGEPKVRPSRRFFGLGKADDDGPVAPGQSRLSKDNRALLQEALFDLLECKRLLDQVR